MYAGGLNSPAGQKSAAEGRRLLREKQIAEGTIVSNKVLRARFDAVIGRPGYAMVEIAERAGFVSKTSGQIDTTYLKRQLGLQRTAPCQKKGVKYPGTLMDYIKYDTAVRICRAMDMYPVEAGL